MAEEMIHEPMGAQDVTQDDKLWALLSWLLWPIAVIVLLIDKKERPFIKYHAVQALVFGVVTYVISGILSTILIGCFLGLAVFVYMIYLAIKAYQGEWITIPFVTDFCKNQGWI
ncbi:MAG TPA: DUF4870 domain-containing protein [Chloroflexi bacterium]|nr:DUF4870 domain-containing protein [Chloroflexota bacterium]